MSSLTFLQRFLVGESDLRYFEDGRHFEDGELPHHILHFADRDALGGAPNVLVSEVDFGKYQNPK